MKKTTVKNKKFKTLNDLLDKWSVEEIVDYYIKQNHSKKECWKYFDTSERVFRRFLKQYHVKKSSEDIVKLTKRVNFERYGDPNYNNMSKIKETCLQKYGTESPLQNKDIWCKTYSKMVERYGGTGFEIFDTSRKHEVAKVGAKTFWHKYYQDEKTRESYKESQYQTKKKNNSFNTSLAEHNFYLFLCNRYGQDNVIRQYSDDRYSYSCDFYIKSEDLFIELNLHWTHGGRPFNKDDDFCKNKLSVWQEKAKTSKFYMLAIDVWTRRDTDKIKCAYNNSLKYITYYSKEEVYNDFKCEI